jgi:uncharacterized protein YaeQ
LAQPATLHGFHIDLADLDRGVYETLDLRVARHPSETAPHVVLRVLAYALEYGPGLAFGRGISTDEAALSATDDTGQLHLWVDVGAPSADRLHKATKLARDVAVYTARDLGALATSLHGIHRAQAVRLVGLPEAFVADLAHRLDRRNDWGLQHSEGTLYVTVGGVTCEAALVRRFLG